MFAVIDKSSKSRTFNHSELVDAERSSSSRTKRRLPRILLAEDDREMRRLLSEALRRARYEVIEAYDGFRVIDYIGVCLISGRGIDVDLVISDVRMPGVDGLRLLSSLRSHEPALPVILITAFGNPELHAEAKRRGAAAVFDKPFEFDKLLTLADQIIRRDDISRRGSESNEFDPIN